MVDIEWLLLIFLKLVIILAHSIWHAWLLSVSVMRSIHYHIILHHSLLMLLVLHVNRVDVDIVKDVIIDIRNVLSSACLEILRLHLYRFDIIMKLTLRWMLLSDWWWMIHQWACRNCWILSFHHNRSFCLFEHAVSSHCSECWVSFTSWWECRLTFSMAFININKAWRWLREILILFIKIWLILKIRQWLWLDIWDSRLNMLLESWSHTFSVARWI